MPISVGQTEPSSLTAKQYQEPLGNASREKHTNLGGNYLLTYRKVASEPRGYTFVCTEVENEAASI